MNKISSHYNLIVLIQLKDRQKYLLLLSRRHFTAFQVNNSNPGPLFPLSLYFLF